MDKMEGTDGVEGADGNEGAEKEKEKGRPRGGETIEDALWSRLEGIPPAKDAEGNEIEGSRDERGNPYPSDNCWLIHQERREAWPGGPVRLYPEGSPRGDFTTSYQGVRKSIQRHAWEAVNGKFSANDRRRIYMTCHNGKKCANPSHMYIREIDESNNTRPYRQRRRLPVSTKYNKTPHKFIRRPDLK